MERKHDARHDLFYKKNLYLFVVLFSLLFNVQAGLTHGVEHINHIDHGHHEDSSMECEDCLLNHLLVKSKDASNDFELNFPNNSNLFDNYNLSNSFTYIFVAFQSNAP